MEKLKAQIEQIKKKVFEGRMQGGISPTYGKKLYEEIDKALSLYNVVGRREQLLCCCANPNGFKEMEQGKETCSKCKKPY